MDKVLPALAVTAALLLPGLSAAQKPASNGIDPSNITAIDELQRGTMATVQGRVERILDTDEFRIADASGDIVVYIGWQNYVPVDVGDIVTVKGFVDDGLFRELYARKIVHPDGRVTELHNRS